MLSGFLRCWSEFLTSCWPKRRNTIDWWWFLMERHSNPSEEAIPINSTSPWCVSVTTWSHSGHQKVWDFHGTGLCPQPSYFDSSMGGSYMRDLSVRYSECCCASPQPPCRFRLFSTQARWIGIAEISTALPVWGHSLSYVQASKWVSRGSQVKINGCRFISAALSTSTIYNLPWSICSTELHSVFLLSRCLSLIPADCRSMSYAKCLPFGWHSCWRILVFLGFFRSLFVSIRTTMVQLHLVIKGVTSLYFS